jgi:CHAD domain-containing protein
LLGSMLPPSPLSNPREPPEPRTIDGVNSAEVTYYDVPERRLALAALTLSRSLENGKGLWRLELPRSNGDSLRVEQAGGPARPPVEVRRVMPAFLRSSKVEPVFDSIESDSGASSDAIGRLRSMLARQYAEILRHDPGVRLDLDPEDVHRLRVAVRRARAILRAARPVLDREWSEPLRDELKWLGGSLGRRRDLDVLIGHLKTQIEELDPPERSPAETLVELLVAERETAQALALDALESKRYYSLLDALEEATHGPHVQRGAVSLRKLARKEFKRLRKVADGLGPDSTDEELHRARILGKRARYTAELAEPEVGKPAQRFVTRAKTFQDVLGAHQDAIVAEGRLRGLLAEAPGSGAAFAAGRLVERERARRREARAELPKAWHALERSAKAAWG